MAEVRAAQGLSCESWSEKVLPWTASHSTTGQLPWTRKGLIDPTFFVFNLNPKEVKCSERGVGLGTPGNLWRSALVSD